jgi:hypothetical protein
MLDPPGRRQETDSIERLGGLVLERSHPPNLLTGPNQSGCIEGSSLGLTSRVGQTRSIPRRRGVL